MFREEPQPALTAHNKPLNCCREKFENVRGVYPAGSGTREQIKRIQNVLFKKQKTNKHIQKNNKEEENTYKKPSTNPHDPLRPDS